MAGSDSKALDALAAFAPGRVNLIGEHTDYSGGLAMPIAIELGTEVRFARDRGADAVELRSSVESEPARIPLRISSEDVGALPATWARFVAGVVAVLRPTQGGIGAVTTDLPIGAGLASSASLELALALALGATQEGAEVARACQQAEQLATGVETGVLDQLAIVSAIEGHATLLDCGELSVEQVTIPAQATFLVVDSGLRRVAAGAVYAERVRDCALAAELIGPLRSARRDDVETIASATLRRRARHVVTENERVGAFAAAMRTGDLQAAGRLMDESHASLAGDYDVSHPKLDQLVEWLRGLAGVLGARLTGAGLGGCAVALVSSETAAGASLEDQLGGRRHWWVHPSRGARLC